MKVSVIKTIGRNARSAHTGAVTFWELHISGSARHASPLDAIRHIEDFDKEVRAVREDMSEEELINS